MRDRSCLIRRMLLIVSDPLVQRAIILTAAFVVGACSRSSYFSFGGFVEAEENIVAPSLISRILRRLLVT